jgi:isocitrate lyase
MNAKLAKQADDLSRDWGLNPRWASVRRPYEALQVAKLRPSIHIEHTLAQLGSQKLWELLTHGPLVTTYGALTGSQAVQMVKAGLKAIYVSGWQVAADANLSGETYPDQSLYPSNSVPALVRRINSALRRADEINRHENENTSFYAPIVADGEAGFGGPLHAFELMKALIEAGASGTHFEDQLAAEKKCGHLGGKVLVPTAQFIKVLIAARLAADVLGVPTVLVARTDALGATLLTSDIDPRDQPFLTGKRTQEGFFLIRNGMEAVIGRSLAYAPLADVLWFETSKPDLGEAREFATEIHRLFPGKCLAYNCSPSFNWKKHLSARDIASFQTKLGELGYRFQFITLAGWHLQNLASFELARDYAAHGMEAYVKIQEEELALEPEGYTAVRHQHEVGTGYFDHVLEVISGGAASTAALAGSTEKEQFTAA